MQLVVALLAALLSIVVIVAFCLRRRAAARLDRGTAACAAAWTVAVAAWTVAVATGAVDCLAPLACAPMGIAAIAATACQSARGAMREKAAAAIAVRAALVVAAVPAAFFLLEWPYNAELFAMDWRYAALNLQLIAIALLAVWLTFQRRSLPVVAFCAACLAIGLANYFVCQFKGQTILPADVAALQTAAAVAGGYEYVLDAPAVWGFVVLYAVAALATACPPPLAPAGGGRVVVAIASLVCGLALAFGLADWYEGHDIEQEYGVKVDVWATRDSYMEFGSVPSFLQRLQEISPDAPAGYGTASAAAVQAALAGDFDRAHPDYTGSVEDAPCVVAIMNESFSDLSTYPGIDGYEGIGDFWAIDAEEEGWVYTSVRGGGTCNSEFEYLTGSTLGSLGGGVYPYMFYDLSRAESLPEYFSSLGYATHAIHPAEPQNWRRDVVYDQLGFDDFVSEGSFEGAERLRDLVTDAETYRVILDYLSDRSAPQFVFDVTIQNHGGYTTGLVDQGPYADVTVGGSAVEGMGEFLAVMDGSLDDLDEFLAAVSRLDRKVVVVFFGDHQPGFNDQVAEAAYGVDVSDLSIEQVQQRFVTPYMIWANYDLPDFGSHGRGDGAPDATVGTSLGYLMARTCYAAGLPLTEYQKALLALEQRMPAVNLNGYCDDTWSWSWIGQDGPASDAFGDYRIVQYANLFDADGNAAFDGFCAQ